MITNTYAITMSTGIGLTDESIVQLFLHSQQASGHSGILVLFRKTKENNSDDLFINDLISQNYHIFMQSYLSMSFSAMLVAVASPHPQKLDIHLKYLPLQSTRFAVTWTLIAQLTVIHTSNHRKQGGVDQQHPEYSHNR